MRTTLTAAKELGAEGFQIGSLLLASQESALQDFEKDRLKSVTEKDIVLTKSFLDVTQEELKISLLKRLKIQSIFCLILIKIN
ncbi:hypothetical protein [Chryseobacterium indoltheticum]|uniref:hypothetical protein n=1 Tax=Chryseobacterium indoltheticum TaxID=254 RepID=UPI003F495C3A